jgi:hypothetical protein
MFHQPLNAWIGAQPFQIAGKDQARQFGIGKDGLNRRIVLERRDLSHQPRIGRQLLLNRGDLRPID